MKRVPEVGEVPEEPGVQEKSPIALPPSDVECWTLSVDLQL